MDEATTIRHRVLVQRVSMRQVALEMGVSRNTVRRYVSGAPIEEGRKPSTRPKPALEKAKPRLDALLAEAPRWTAGSEREGAGGTHQ